MRVGVIGCGVISRRYSENAKAFDSFELVACADVLPGQAEELAKLNGMAATGVDDLVADPSIDVLLNLTPPAVHAAIVREGLEAGKHVYTEKPLTTETADSLHLVDISDGAGLRIGCAPDIFLGGAYQAGRALIDAGVIGEPLSVSAAMLVGEQERWHPNPDIFFSDGAGPLLDMGPYYLSAIVALLGPISRVAGFASTRTRERTIQIGPRAGERFSSLTPSHASAVMELESGVTANLVASFEAVNQYICDLEIHGTEGVLALPDPNAFGGPVRVKVGHGDWEDVPYASRGAQDARGLGLHDMALAIGLDRPHRASGRLGAHVVEVARGILRSAEEGRVVEIESRLDQPDPLPVPAVA